MEPSAHEILNQMGGREQCSGLLCPKCQGGKSGERTLSAWWMGGRLVAKCWRAKCRALFGFLHGRPAAFTEARTIPPPETVPVSERLAKYLLERYRISGDTLQHFRVREHARGFAAVLRVVSPTGELRGWTVRHLEQRDGPKAVSLRRQAAGSQPWLAWYIVRRREPVFAVEDHFSAMRLYQRGVNAVALTSTEMNPSRAAELRGVGTPVVLCLDNNATLSAMQFARRFHLEVRQLREDIKDMTEDALRLWIHSVTLSLPALDRGAHSPSSTRAG